MLLSLTLFCALGLFAKSSYDYDEFPQWEPLPDDFLPDVVDETPEPPIETPSLAFYRNAEKNGTPVEPRRATFQKGYIEKWIAVISDELTKATQSNAVLMETNTQLQAENKQLKDKIYNLKVLINRLYETSHD